MVVVVALYTKSFQTVVEAASISVDTAAAAVVAVSRMTEVDEVDVENEMHSGSSLPRAVLQSLSRCL